MKVSVRFSEYRQGLSQTVTGVTVVSRPQRCPGGRGLGRSTEKGGMSAGQSQWGPKNEHKGQKKKCLRKRRKGVRVR
jgi:hypothetical protein